MVPLRRTLVSKFNFFAETITDPIHMDGLVYCITNCSFMINVYVPLCPFPPTGMKLVCVS